ncbi:hypothetical protein ACFSDD_17785 [Salipiger marinus]|uniref:hypothetical protein n=1 Tax=Salipiger marinus TaxID=555512 RepID=UPI002C876F50|nr:hypothetical protein [Salipiger manganoxidans]MEB3421735.1 hypothetical protein [Salipiger manganoxidans]
MIQMKDIGALILPLRAAANAAATAGGTGDNTAVTGAIIDRAAVGMPQSGVLAIPFTATLAAGATLSVTYTVQEGETDDLSDAATLITDTVVAATGPTGGGTVTGCLALDVKLRAGGRYVRCNYTPNLSAANTDTAALSALLICGGMDRLPQ